MPAPIRFDQDPDSPPGTGSFTFSDGRSIFAHEPELASRLGPDMRTAQNAIQLGDVEVTGDAAPPDQRTAMGPPGPPREVSDVQAPVPGMGAPPEAPAGPTEGYQDISALNMSRAAPAGPQVVPSPTVSMPSRRGGMMPSTQTVTTEAGPEYDPLAAADRSMANRDVVKATMAQHASAAQAAENEALSLQIQGQDLKRQAFEQERELSDKDSRYKEERARAQVYVKAAEERKLDPKKLYKDAGIGGSIALIIGQALGAFGASLAGGENWAGKMVSDAMDRDMAAQEDEIKSGRASANNALARLSEEMGGDVEQAKSALKMTRLAALDSQIKEHAAWAKVPQAQQAADLWLAQNQQARLAEEQKFQQASMGKTTTTASLKYQAPQAGGVRQKTLKEMAEDKKYADYLNGQGGIDGKPVRDGYSALAEAKAVERYGGKMKDPESIIGQVEDVMNVAGGRRVNGQIVLDKPIQGVGIIDSHTPNIWAGDQGRAFRQNFKQLASTVVQAKSGASATEQEVKRLNEMMAGGTMTKDEYQEGLNIIDRAAKRSKENIVRSFPPEVRRTYEAQGASAADDEVGELP